MRSTSFIRGVAMLAGALVVVGCNDSPDLTGPRPAVGGDLFRSYVNIGNSIGAGFQSGGINAQTQLQSYAVLLAQQVHTRFAVPLLAGRGCPPPITNLLTGARVGGGTATTCDLRDPAFSTAVLNNVAVPGASSADPTSVSGPGANALTTLFLGGKSQVARALEAHPTFATVEIIDNDVLEAAISGVLVPTPGVSPGFTPVATFTANYAKIVDQLVAGGVKKGVLFTTADVVNAPILFPAAALQNAAFRVGLELVANGGHPIVILPNCMGSTSLISVGIVAAIAAKDHPPTIGCEKNSVPGTAVGDVFVLDAAEQTELAGVVAAYNAYIKAKADSVGYGVYDVNTTLVAAKASGEILTVPSFDPLTPFGVFMSRDPVHPSAFGQRRIVNDLIDAIDAKYGVTIPKVQVGAAHIAA